MPAFGPAPTNWQGGSFPTGGSQSTGQSFNIGVQAAQNQQQAANNAVNQSQSQSFIPEYSQTPILERIAQEAEGMAPQVYQWGMDQFNRNQGNIDNLMRQGKLWASPQHIATMMGQAEAGVQQSGEQARQAAINDLQSYGINPSSGRYAALDQASRVQTAAAAAGAGNQQRQADIAQGQTMQNQAISAGLQNTQIGYGAANAMNSLYGTGMQLKYSPLGTTASSSGVSAGASTGSGWSTGTTLGESTQQAQSFQQQPVNVMKNVGVMVQRGGYIGRGEVEEAPGYQMGGGIKRPRRKGASFKKPSRGKMQQFPGGGGSAKTRPPGGGDDREQPDDTAPAPGVPMGPPSSGFSNVGSDDEEQPGVPVGYQEGGDVTYAGGDTGGGGVTGVSRDELERMQEQLRREEETPMLAAPSDPNYGSPYPSRGEDPNYGKSYFSGQPLSGGAGLRSPPPALAGEGGQYRGPTQPGDPMYVAPGSNPEAVPMPQPRPGEAGPGDSNPGYTGDYDPSMDFPATVNPPRGGQPPPQDPGVQDWKRQYGAPPTGTQERPVTPDQGPESGWTKQPDGSWIGPNGERAIPREDMRPGYQGPPVTTQPPATQQPPEVPRNWPAPQPTPGQPDKWTVQPPATTTRPPIPGTVPMSPPGQSPPVQAPPGSGGGGGGKQPAPELRYREQVPPRMGRWGPGGGPMEQSADIRQYPELYGGYRGGWKPWINPGDLTGPRDPMTGQATYGGEPGEYDYSDASITGKFGRRLATQTALGAAEMLAQELGGRRRRRGGYAAGGVVGTNTGGFTPTAPLAATPIGSPVGYARGGGVTAGGFVSQAYSPSNGHQVDDVPARLNEGEYVIPRDVVHWKGKDFFHKLIAQSRAHRAKVGAPSDDRGYNLGGAI